MFGALRFLLAYLVVASHLVGSEYLAHFGFYAVRGFFVISGFLMTAALNDVYRFNGVRFWLNRILRLLPPYVFVCALTLAIVSSMPTQAAMFLKFWRATPNLSDMLGNLAVLPLQFPGVSFRMIPPFWSVAVEIDMYLMLYLVIARRVFWAWLALIAGLSYQLAGSYAGMSWSGYYFTAPAAVLPFAVGALLYFLVSRNGWTLNGWTSIAAFIAWLANMVAGGWIFPDSYIFGIGYYVDTVLFTVVAAGLIGRRLSPSIETADKVLGEWAYPVFLVQWLVGFVVVVTFLHEVSRGWELMLLAAVPIALAGAGLAVLNRKFVEPLRGKVREVGLQAPSVADHEAQVTL